MAEPAGPKLVPSQAVARRRARRFALLSLALILAGMACAFIGEFEWGMALWGIAFWPYGRTEEARGWADGYSAGVLTGATVPDVQVTEYADGYADGWRDAHDHAQEADWK